MWKLLPAAAARGEHGVAGGPEGGRVELRIARGAQQLGLKQMTVAGYADLELRRALYAALAGRIRVDFRFRDRGTDSSASKPARDGACGRLVAAAGGAGAEGTRTGGGSGAASASAATSWSGPSGRGCGG